MGRCILGQHHSQTGYRIWDRGKRCAAGMPLNWSGSWGQGHFPSSYFILSPAQKRSLPLHLLHTIHVSVGFNLTTLQLALFQAEEFSYMLLFLKGCHSLVLFFFFLLVLASSLTLLLRWLKPQAVIKMRVGDIRSFPCCSSNFADNSEYLICLSCSSLCWGTYKSSVSFWVITAKSELIPVHV